MVSHREEILAICADEGCSPDILVAPEAAVPMSFLEKVWALGTKVSAYQPGIMFKIASTFSMEDMGPKGLLLSSAFNLREMNGWSESFSASLGSLYNTYLDESTEGVVERRYRLSDEFLIAPPVAQYISGCMLAGWKLQVPVHDYLLKAYLPYPQPTSQEHLKSHTDFFNCELIFDHHEIALSYRKEVMDYPFKTFNPKLRSFLSEYFKKDLETLSLMKSKDSLVQVTRTIIRENLNRLGFGIEPVARILNISARTLERHLANEGESFRQLKEQLQEQVATSLLQEGQAVKDVAYKVGFSNLSSFSRAYKRWTGRSPKKAKAGEIDASE